MRLGRLKITASRWPWMPASPHWANGIGKGSKGPTYGWGRVSGMGRFGGGWDWKLGLSLSDRTLLVDLVFGSISFYLEASK